MYDDYLEEYEVLYPNPYLDRFEGEEYDDYFLVDE